MCLSEIVTTGYCDAVPLSGLKLKDAPEISSINLSKIADEDAVSGKQLAEDKLDLAVILLKNDFMAMLATNKVLPILTNTKYSTGDFKLDTVISATAVERGVTLITNIGTRGKLRQTTIHTISMYPLASATGATLKIYDDWAGDIVSTYTINLIANQVNELDVEYTIKGDFARVVLLGTGLTLADSYLTTCAGCSGSLPNDCAYTQSSYDGSDINGKSGYGINLLYSCNCDYESLLCGLKDQYIGQLIWLKARILIMEELLMSNRWNHVTVYNREDMAGFLSGVKTEYTNLWQSFGTSLPTILKQYNDSCLSCRGTAWVTNI